MEKTCVVCHDRPADFRCVQCHKPVCDECAFKDAQGAFCSRECAANYSSFQEHGKEEAGTGILGGLAKKLITGLVLLLVALGVYVYGARQGWFGEKEKERVSEGRKKLEEGISEGKEKVKDLREDVESKVAE